MRVSVIVPLFNKSRTIERALRSIVAQRFSDFEVIVVNDGSTDDSARQACAVKDDRIRVISTENGGPGAARNRGVAESRGEILAFLDGDDAWLPHYLDHSLNILDSFGERIGAAVVGYEHYPTGRSTESLWRGRGLRDGVFSLTPSTSPELFLALIAYMSPWSTVIRREIFEHWGGFCGTNGVRYAEDSFLWLKIVLNSDIGVSLSPPCARYHTEDSDLTRRRRGPRQVEPFLTDPSSVVAACPPRLRPLLDEVLARRALKTACMLGYWGHWREARTLLDRFEKTRWNRSKYYFPAVIASSPLAAPLGRTLRGLRYVL